MAAKICVSIALTDIQSITKLSNQAFEEGADYVEIRLDFLRLEQLQEAIEALKSMRSMAIFTLRSKGQGGKFVGSEQDRVNWLQKLAEQKPMLLDVELPTLQQNDELADFLERQQTSLLVSWHDFQETPSNDRIADLLSEMRIYSNYVKIVTTAKSVDDSLRLLELYESATGLHPIFFAMGEAGVVSRLLCTVIGNAPFTYASLDEPMAPGQLTLKQMRKLYDKMKM
jgi:3-dehydroquinate dehydratase-1